MYTLTLRSAALQLSIAALLVAGFVSFTMPAHAAGLTETQIQAIMSLLSSFGADQSVINNVNDSLHGQETTGSVAAGTSTTSCLTITQNLYAGLTDSSTGGQVTQLQQFLGVNPTGYFGPMTQQALQNWQSAHGVVSSGSPDTTGYGFAGPATRSAMGCGGSNPQPHPNSSFTVSPTSGAAPLVVTFTSPYGRPQGNVGAWVSLDFGDGSETQNVTCSPASTQTGPTTLLGYGLQCVTPVAISHTYAAAGTYTTTLNSCMSSPGLPCVSLGTATITVTGGTTQTSVPTCTETADKSSINPGDSVTFSWRSQNATYAVDKFGDKLSANGQQSVTIGTAGMTYPFSNYTWPLTFYSASGGSSGCNSVSVVVNSLNASATIDQSSLSSTSIHPRITGTAHGVNAIGLSIGKDGGKFDGTGTFNMDQYGNWGVTLNNQTYQPGTYQVDVYSDTNVLLVSGTLTVTGSITPIPPSIRAAQGDLNGDGVADIPLQNGQQIAVWLMNGLAVKTESGNVTPIVGLAPATPVAIGDFNGDGKNDLLLQTGQQLLIQEMNGKTIVTSTAVQSNLGTGWSVVGAGDFNGDGKADILLQNGQQLAEWQMNGTQILPTSGNISAPLGAGWSVAAVGDLDHDSKDDILLKNGQQIAVWLMNGLAVKTESGNVTPIVGLAPATPVAIGDFNGDGKNDLLLQTGQQLLIQEMNGKTIVTSTAVQSNLGTGWSVVGAGDFNGDGKADILLQNGQQLAEWQMNGTQILPTSGNISAPLGAGWSPIFSPQGLVLGASTQTLTDVQIQAILSLLSSFGADSTTINNVNAALHGQATGGSGSNTSTQPSCLSLSYDLYSGSTDATTNGQVSTLQKFLGISPTGFFGPLTEQAVQNWQSSHGVVSSGSPDTTGYGFVGTHTRAAMGCGSTNVQIPTSPATYTPPTTNQSVSFSATPTSGPGPLPVTFASNVGRNYAIDFGDGSSAWVGNNPNGQTIGACANASGCTYTTTHTYQLGSYTATLKDSSGNSLGTATIIVTGSNTTQTNPVVINSFAVTPGSVTAGQPVTFSWNSNLSTTDISSYGGGCYISPANNLGNELNINSNYGPNGTYTYTPSATATYTLDCWSGGKDGSPNATRQITVGVSLQNTSLTLTAPSTNSTYHVGDQIPIVWNYSNVPPNSQTKLTLALIQASSNTGHISGGGWQQITSISGSGQGNYNWQTGAGGYLDIPGTYQLSAAVTQCDPLGCQYSYPADSSLPVYATASPVQFTIAPSLAPTCYVTASQSSVLTNQVFTLTWGSTNATYMTGIKTQSTWPPNGSQAMTAGSSGQQTYTLTFVGPNGQTSCSTTVTASNSVTITSSLNSTPNSNFTLAGASTISGTLYVVLVGSNYAGPTDWNDIQQLIVSGQTNYAVKSASVLVSNGQWSAPFSGLPEATFNVYIFDTSGNLLDQGVFQSTYKG